MTVPNEIPSNNYIANGVVKKFSVTFHYETTDTLRIKLNGNEPPTDKYYIDDVDHSFNFYLPPSNGDIIYIYRDTPLERDIDYDNNYNSFRPKTVNTDFDRVWRVMQESFEQLRQVDIDYDFVLNQVRPISTGGTGADNAEDARTNLNIYSKQEIVDYLNEKLSKSSNLSDLENIAEALTNISVYNKAEVDALVATGGQGNIVPVSGGGTGATNSAAARTNLEVPAYKHIKTTIDLDTIMESGLYAITATSSPNVPATAWGSLMVVANTFTDGSKRAHQTFITDTTVPRIFIRAYRVGVWNPWLELDVNATETTAGKAKIATTAIAQAGVNDTDFITPLKLHQKIKNVSFGINQVLSDPTTLANTWYTNTSGKVMFAHKMQSGTNHSVVIKVRVESIEYSFSSGSLGNNLAGSISVMAIIPIGAEYQCNYANMIIFS